MAIRADVDVNVTKSSRNVTVDYNKDSGTTDYNKLKNKPSINDVELIGNKTTSDLKISYNDLIDKPTVGEGRITILKNSQPQGSFNVNQANNSSVNIPVPTNVSELNNDSNYQTQEQQTEAISHHNTSNDAHENRFSQ